VKKRTRTHRVLDDIEPLIEELGQLRYEEDQDRFDDIVAELVNHGEALRDHFVAMADNVVYQQRRAAVEALGRLNLPNTRAILLAKLADANWKVRHSAALAVASAPFEDALEPLLGLAEDRHRELRIGVIEALGALQLEQGCDAVEGLMADEDWRVRQAAAMALERIGNLRSFQPLIVTLGDDDEDVRAAASTALATLLGQADAAFLQDVLGSLEDHQIRHAQEIISTDVNRERFARLRYEIEHFLGGQVNVEELSKFGRVLTADDHLPMLDRAFERSKEVDNLARILAKQGGRSIILLGESGVGKTAIIHELARRLSTDDPMTTVLETSTPELMVGTKYIGEWETKLRGLVEQIRAPRRVYLYLTNINDLPGAGTTSSNKQNFSTLLAPYMRRGDVTIIGESTAEALRRGIETDLSVKGMFKLVNIGEPDGQSTSTIVRESLGEMGRRAGIKFVASPEVLALLIDLSGTYYATMAQPGRSVTVLRQVVDFVSESVETPMGEVDAPKTPVEIRITSEDVIGGLARFTGLPELLLNDKMPLDPAVVRAFFEDRVLGQPEAVSSIVDLITLIKAGLTDPSKPFGVFLFVGPTGVGKTELAKALAEFIFGSESRLLRFDLSEYRDYESFEKLIGGTIRYRDEGRLTSKVREQPFSVILLDEIEKAHPNIFDLFLQVFDDGRLTDGAGRIADFRHTIIIMTSNLGSAFVPGGPVGFGGDEASSLASKEGVIREVQRFFRPEFLNRIDRTVVFNRLGTEVMRMIARRELGKILHRSGLLRRRLVVDIEPSVVDFLMDQGFSPAFGARPLKRAVETNVLLPVARQIVTSGPGYGGEVLHVRGMGDAVEVSRDPDSPVAGTSLSLEKTPLSALATRPQSRRQAGARSRAGRAHLLELMQRAPTETLRQAIREMEETMGEVTFWDDPECARAVLIRRSRVQRLLDRVDRLRINIDRIAAMLDAQPRISLDEWHREFRLWLAELHTAQQAVTTI
jgi:ATP-dependent Clp protease ATP-binding subunit ClpC